MKPPKPKHEYLLTWLKEDKYCVKLGGKKETGKEQYLLVLADATIWLGEVFG